MIILIKEIENEKFIIYFLTLFESLQNDSLKLIEPLYPHIKSTPTFSFSYTTTNFLLFTFILMSLQIFLAKYLFRINVKFWKVIAPFNFSIIKESFKFNFLKGSIVFFLLLINELIKYLVYFNLIVLIYHKLEDTNTIN